MFQMERNYSEKRDFIRMQMNTQITLSQGGQTIQGVCQDLSGTGMQVLAKSAFSLGEKIRVQIPSEHAELDGLDALTEVVRVDSHEDGRQSLGLTILSMS
ncbi:PilZ domain-containing protein [Stutzerimonas stutzeri]|uniref:PilZ domain-containing protein n=1 Tax=Stutzerimonas stutzeri TaxID=316 RepID=UPI00210D6C31|nr:PilZ domain-containing protein [Stutzerimonas stutzeri]MCQ4258983.1 PilZ domain-containing protein [Stutzerimonas stutzeri]